MTIENKYPIPRMLAMRVLKEALQDCVRPLSIKWDQVKAAKRDAIDFLFNKDRAEDVEMWCAMADIKYHTFMERAREVYEKQIDISKVEAELRELASQEAVSEEDDDAEAP